MPELSSLIASILMRLRRGLRLRWQKGVADRWFFCAGHVFFLVIVRASNGWHACQRYIGQDARRGRAGLQPYVRRLWPLLLSKIPYEPCKASNGVHHMTSTSYHLKAIFVFLVCAFFLGGKVFAEDEIPPIPVKRGDTFVDLKAFESFLAHNGGEVNTTAAGDLAGMGEVQAVSTLSPDYQIFLLVHDKNGQLRLAAHTKLRDDRYRDLSVSLRVGKGSLFITLDTLQGVLGTYQFKRQPHGRLRLIGIKLHVSTLGPDPEDGEASHGGEGVVDTDFNLMTGKMLIKQLGNQPVTAQFSGPACYFEDFDFHLYICAESMKTADGVSARKLMLPH